MRAAGAASPAFKGSKQGDSGPLKDEMTLSRSSKAPGDGKVKKSPTKAAGSRDFHAEMAIYQNERFYPIKGWSDRLLPTDRHTWCV